MQERRCTYLNFPSRNAFVHSSDCSYANRGRGIHGGTQDEKEIRGNGMWVALPDNLTLDEACDAVREIFGPALRQRPGTWYVRPCGHCGGGL